MVDLKPTISQFCSLIGVDLRCVDSPDGLADFCADGAVLLRFLTIMFPDDFWTIYPISDAGFHGSFIFARKCADCGLESGLVPCGVFTGKVEEETRLVTAISFLLSKHVKSSTQSLSEGVLEDFDACVYLISRWKSTVRILSSEEHVFGKLAHSVRRLVEEGIPRAAREHAWLVMSGALHQVRARNPSYLSLFPRALEESAHQELIDLDISRTFQDSPEWRKKGFDQVTRRILLAYSIRNPSLGYCQGLSYIAGLLAAVASEEVAFCIFSTILEDGLVPPDYYTSLKGAVVDQQVIEALAIRFIPGLEVSDEISFMSIPWSMCLFSTSFSMQVSIRLWDYMFAFGPCVLFRVSLGLLYSLGGSMHGARDRLKQIEVSTTESDISVYFKQFESVSNELLAEIRNEIRSASPPSDCFLSVTKETGPLSVSDADFFAAESAASSSSVRPGNRTRKREKEARKRVVEGLCKFMFSQQS